jgi:hypothetical protein
MAKRPFRKLKGVSKANDEYAQKHDRRPFVFNVTTKDGGTMEYQGNVAIEQVDRLCEMFNEVIKMQDAEPSA